MTPLTGQAMRVTELERRLANLIQAGRVVECNYPAYRVRVQLGDLTTAWLPWLTLRAGGDREWWAPEIGEQVIVLSPCGDPAQGWILPAGFQTDHPANGDRETIHRTTYQDGAVVEYDREAHHLSAVLPGGSASLLVGKTVTIEAGESIGAEAPQINIQGATGDVIIGGVSLVHHVHPGVWPGPAVTGEPQ